MFLIVQSSDGWKVEKFKQKYKILLGVQFSLILFYEIYQIKQILCWAGLVTNNEIGINPPILFFL